ncbi:MAG: DUF5696 domain-containing protein [Oscillospiraceae bacterium]|nr:DUF5696 domain-containing protein [Oscillospiraceae bacterium]
MRLSKKILLLALAAAALVTLTYQGYLTVRYRLYGGHKAVLSAPAAHEEGRPFAALADASADVPGMALAAENDVLKLYVSLDDANVALYDKRSGESVYAVPPGAEEDPVAAGINKSLLKSQLTLDYFNEERLRARMNSFDHSIALEQFRFESLENGLRCVYTLGDISSPTGLVPVYITEERLERFLSVYEGTRDYTRNRMRYVESREAPGHLELMESIRTAKATLRELETILTGAGYTQEDYAADMAGSGVEGAVPLHFVIELDYILDGDSLEVRLDTGRVSEYADGRIEKIQLLRAFGAGGMDEEGYLMVPNGSGSLIRFNNGKSYADEYEQYIYGQDPLMSEYATLGNTVTARLPFFGIERPGRTLLGRVESGESLAYLTAGVSGKVNAYNYVYPAFVLRGSMSLAMFGMTGNEATLPVVEKEMPAVLLAVRYSLLPGDYEGYSGMARRAREQLAAEGVLSGSARTGDIPFYMDVVGSVLGQKFFAGVSYMGQIPMTRYEEAAEMSAELTALGVRRQVVNYQGWFNRGYYHDVADKIKPVRALGRTGELEELAAALEEQGGQLYSDTALQSVPWSSRRYRYELESSRYYGGGMVAGFGLVSPITLYNTFSMGYLEVMYNILSPRFLTRYTESFTRAMSRYDPGIGVSLRDMGDILASDRKRTDMIHREEAREIVSHNLDLLDGLGRSLMVSGGNLYALRVSDDLINVPMAHNALYMVDEEIPFYAMVVHGHIDYAGEPVNLNDAYDEREIALRLIEHGASPRFAFTYRSSSDMKYTGLNRMYSTHYQSWQASAAELYHTVNGALAPVAGCEMLRHEILPGGVRRVTYSNGVQILINRSDREQRAGGDVLEPLSFIVKEGAV